MIGTGGAVGLDWLQPWRLFTNTTVAEQRSSASAPVTGMPSTRATGPGADAATASRPTVVRQGTSVTHEHPTSGAAHLVHNADGSHHLELVGLGTSDGPDLRVWQAAPQVRTDSADRHVLDDGQRVDVDRLKGNRGGQVYPVPEDVPDSRGVSIRCQRYLVSFGAASPR